MTVTELFYSASQTLLHPVLWAIYLSFIYSLYELGRFMAQKFVRYRHADTFKQMNQGNKKLSVIAGYPIIQFALKVNNANASDIEIRAFELLELVKLVTRITPMLGLIATLIPMGPALMAMTENNVVAMSEHLRTAFTAVILALSAASITFWIGTVKKRWYAQEIATLEKQGH